MDIQNWNPPCEAADATDEQLQSAPFAKDILEGPMAAFMSRDGLLKVVRDVWKDASEQLKVAVYNPLIEALFVKCDERGEETNDKLILTREKRPDGSFHYVLKTGRKRGGSSKRLKDSDIARLIGYGEAEGSEKGKLAQAGGFIYSRKGGSVNKAATFELVIEDGDAENKVCSEYSVRLLTNIEGESHPTFVYPPQSGDKDNLRRDDEVYEVTSWTQMSKESLINSPFSPIKLFDLAGHLAALDEDDDEDENESDESAEGADIDDLLDDEDD